MLYIHSTLLHSTSLLLNNPLTLALALPGQDHHAVDLLLRAEVNHEDGLVRVIVVHDGTVGQVGVLLTVHSQGAVSVLPLLPGVSLVVDPGLALEGLVGHYK